MPVKSCGMPHKKSALTLNSKFSVASRRFTPTHERPAETDRTGVRIFCLSEAQGDVPVRNDVTLSPNRICGGAVSLAFALAQVAKRIKEALGARKAESVKGEPQAS